jgi:hypothetical protein
VINSAKLEWDNIGLFCHLSWSEEISFLQTGSSPAMRTSEVFLSSDDGALFSHCSVDDGEFT